jgi:hypothetical protein
MRARTSLITLAATVLMLPAVPARAAPPSPANAGALTWSVAPAGPEGPNGRPSLTYKLDPGATLTDHVAVTNHSKRPLNLRLYASDAFTTADGGFDLKAGNARPVDVGSWVKTAQADLAVPATSRVVVPVTIAVPGNATPGDHVGGIVASLAATTTGADGNQVSVDHRVGTRIYLRVTGVLRPELRITDVKFITATSWNPLRLPVLTTEFTVRNTGNVRLSGQSEAETHSLFGLAERLSARAALPEILPGGTIRTRAVTEDVMPLLRVWTSVTVQPTSAENSEAQRAVHRSAMWLVPWPQLLTLALAAATFTAWILSRRRRRHRTAAALLAAEQKGREQALAAPNNTRETTDTRRHAAEEDAHENPDSRGSDSNRHLGPDGTRPGEGGTRPGRR